MTLYTLSIYPSVHKQLIRTLFEAHIVYKGTIFRKHAVYKILKIYISTLKILCDLNELINKIFEQLSILKNKGGKGRPLWKKDFLELFKKILLPYKNKIHFILDSLSKYGHTMNCPKKTGFNLYRSRHCAYITSSVKTWFLKNLSVSR